jgi:putative ATP-binding cassette transporter
MDDRVLRRSLLRRFWQTAAGFWGSGTHSSARNLTAGLLLIIVCLLGAAYAMNAWNRAMFDGLQNRDVAAVGKLSILYFVILAASVLLSILQVYVRMALQRRWRAWLTNSLVDRWLAHGRYYQLNLVRGDHANPEYRIADDVRIATESPVDFVSGVTQAFLSAAMFIVVLWTIGGALDISVAGFNLHVPGFLVIAALLYAILASGSMLLIGSSSSRV